MIMNDDDDGVDDGDDGYGYDGGGYDVIDYYGYDGIDDDNGAWW